MTVARVRRSILARLPLVVLFLAMLPASAAGAEPIELRNADGSLLRLQAPARKVITLSPHLTELVFAAGAGDLLLGAVEYSDYPEAARTLPRVGDAFRIDLERLSAMGPDLVLSWSSGNPPRAVARIQDLGIAAWSIEIRRPEEIADTLEAIGRATGRSATARTAAEDARQKLDDIQRQWLDAEPVRYFYQVQERPLYTLNGEHLVSRGLALCGGENVFGGATGIAPQVSREAVLLADPEALFAPRVSGSPDPLAHWLEWPQLAAVRSGALHGLPADQISQATPRFLTVLESACSMLDDLRKLMTNSADE